jgi:uncharacterized protein YyaL (SSP411 family)
MGTFRAGWRSSAAGSPADERQETFQEGRREPALRPGGGGFGWCQAQPDLRLFAALLILVAGCAVQEGDAGVEPAKGRVSSKNKLAGETSPYLLAHADNPVQWYPWGAEALEKARVEDKPIFLSIGYSTCHWCHVMEREVFSNEAIARELNESFVCIKIDREERPDLDELYMTALNVYFQAIGSAQSGGWPLSLFLTPDGRPLGGGTYIAPEDEGEEIGFRTLLGRIRGGWAKDREALEKNADLLARGVRTAAGPRLVLKPVELTRELATGAVKQLATTFDPDYAGFGFDADHPDRAKFPNPPKLALLLYEARSQKNAEARRMALATMDAMAAGGVYDQLGGGFHRYSTDRAWRVPHFEKMLYDNAQLLEVYAEAFQLTNDARYRRVAEETAAFLFREMADVGGGFYAALDAETEGVEGRYYLWLRGELGAALPPADATLVERVFGFGPQPDFPQGHVLRLRRPLVQTADAEGISALELEQRLGAIKTRLLAVRAKREAPFRDEKVLTAWNGLMIRALARAGRVLNRREYVEAAAKAAEFVLGNCRDERGRLLRSYVRGEARAAGCLDDYAYLVEGLLGLYAATEEKKWLNAARRLTEQQNELFRDARLKGYFYTAVDHEKLLARPKTWADTVLPSGNSVSVRNLLRLAEWTGEETYREQAREVLELFGNDLSERPGAMANMALALAEFVDRPDFLANGRGGDSRRSRSAAGIALTSGGGPKEKSARPASAKGKPKPEVVAGKVFLDVDRLPAGRTCRMLVHLTIAEGWHVNANPTGNDFREPVELTITGTRGTKVTRTVYPRGHEIELPEDEGTVWVYDGKASLYADLAIPRAAGGATERLTVSVRYFACEADRCLPPKTLTLEFDVPVAYQDEEVEGRNERLFPKAKPVR